MKPKMLTHIVVSLVPLGALALTHSNCVLRARDCGMSSISQPVVHQYADKWMMWFHGKTSEAKWPISSGRIFVAESEDGLAWRVLPTPVLAENSDEWWSFDSAHVGLGDVAPLERVNSVDEAYRRFSCTSGDAAKAMYFFGGANGDTELRSIGIDRDGSVPAMDLRVGLAVSQGDVDRFARVEGNFPHGEVLSAGECDEWDASYLGWPAVLDLDGERFLTYQALDRTTQRHAVGLASSPKNQPITDFRKLAKLTLQGDFAASGVTRRCLRPHLSSDGSCDMWFEGLSSAGLHAIGLARSDDRLRTWAVHPEPVFAPSREPGAWDAGTVSAPFVCRLDDATLRMYYSGSPANAGTGPGVPVVLNIGVAESNDGGLTWSRPPLFAADDEQDDDDA